METGILVGNNLKIFFIRDAIKFPDMIHAFKPDPITNIQDQRAFFRLLRKLPRIISIWLHLFIPLGVFLQTTA